MLQICADCDFEIFLPVVESDATVLGFYNDDRFPGRCILALRQHADHLDEVPSDLAALLQAQALEVGRALRTLGLADRVNYAVLGNVNRHVHMHIIPRGGPNDANPNRPPWEHPRQSRQLPATERDEIASRLRSALPSL